MTPSENMRQAGAYCTQAAGSSTEYANDIFSAKQELSGIVSRLLGQHGGAEHNPQEEAGGIVNSLREAKAQGDEAMPQLQGYDVGARLLKWLTETDKATDMTIEARRKLGRAIMHILLAQSELDEAAEAYGEVSLKADELGAEAGGIIDR